MRRREKIFQKWITWKIYGFLKVSFAKIIRHGVFIAFAIYLFQVASPWIHSLTSVAEWKEKNLSRRKRFKKWAHDNKKIKQQKQRNTKTKGGKKAAAAANGNRQQDAKRKCKKNSPNLFTYYAYALHTCTLTHQRQPAQYETFAQIFMFSCHPNSLLISFKLIFRSSFVLTFFYSHSHSHAHSLRWFSFAPTLPGHPEKTSIASAISIHSLMPTNT